MVSKVKSEIMSKTADIALYHLEERNWKEPHSAKHVTAYIISMFSSWIRKQNWRLHSTCILDKKTVVNLEKDKVIQLIKHLNTPETRSPKDAFKPSLHVNEVNKAVLEKVKNWSFTTTSTATAQYTKSRSKTSTYLRLWFEWATNINPRL